MKKIYVPFLLIVSLFFSSCVEEISSEDIATEKILRHYSAHCTNNGKVYVKANFYADGGLTIPPFREPFGRNITLNAPSKVLFNGQEMEMTKSTFGEVSYRLNLDEWPNSFRWDWTNKEGGKQSDEANMDRISLSNNPLSQRDDDFVLRWEGAPIGKGEEIVASLSRGDQAFTETSSTIGDQSININRGGYNLDYSDFNEVDITRKLVVSQTKKVAAENVAGVYIELSYRYEIQ